LDQHTATADPKEKPALFDADHEIAKTMVLEQLVSIQACTATFAQYFSKCDSNEFEGASAIFHELDPVEKGLDRWLTALRSGEMNERACAENLHGSLAMLTHLTEIFIKDPLRVLPFTLRGLVSGVEICMDSYSTLSDILKKQMPPDVSPEDGLLYDLLKRTETLQQSAQTAKALTGKLGRSVDEMKSRGLSVEIRHVHSFEGCFQEVKMLTECYRRVCVSLSSTDKRSYRSFQKCSCSQPASTHKVCRLVWML